jgi:hypothetical protein
VIYVSVLGRDSACMGARQFCKPPNYVLARARD